MGSKRVVWEELDRQVQVDLINLRRSITRTMPEVKHVQITIDHVHEESSPTMDVICGTQD